jgi:hypothetical protein
LVSCRIVSYRIVSYRIADRLAGQVSEVAGFLVLQSD